MQILVIVLQALIALVWARFIVSWVVMANPKWRYNPIVEMIHQLTEPLYAPIRQIIPPMGGFDLTPMILLLVLSAVLRTVISLG